MILSWRQAGFRNLEIDTITSQMSLEILMKTLNPKIKILQMRGRWRSCRGKDKACRKDPRLQDSW
jgi:hypothetical protein